MENQAVSELTDKELLAALRRASLPSGPITKGTRKLFENILWRHLNKESGETSDKQSYDDPNQANSERTTWNETLNDNVNTVQQCLISKSANESSQPDTDDDIGTDGSVFYYGVCWNDSELSDLQKKPTIFCTQKDALKAIKNKKGARFKCFRSRAEAEKFSLSSDLSCNNLVVCDEPKNPFKSPTPQEVIIFREAMKRSDKDVVFSLLQSNPKYLISSVETPVIMQEGSRYNGMHVLSRENNLEMCCLLINAINDDKLWKQLYPEETNCKIIQMKKQHLVDLYLNTPDRVALETPLHIACKFGCREVVQYLMSFPSIESNSVNSYGEKPCEIVCSRYTGKDAEVRKSTILQTLEGTAYVPLLRSEYGTTPPMISEPVIPNCSCPTDAGIPIKTDDASSPLGNDVSMKAYAGPMSPKQAEQFYREWKKTLKRKDFMRIPREDYEKGLERLGRRLSSERRVPWSEYWSFLGCFANLSTPSGLDRLESFLRDRWEAFKKQSIQIYSTPARQVRSCSPLDFTLSSSIDLNESDVFNVGSQERKPLNNTDKNDNELCKQNLISKFDERDNSVYADNFSIPLLKHEDDKKNSEGNFFPGLSKESDVELSFDDSTEMVVEGPLSPNMEELISNMNQLTLSDKKKTPSDTLLSDKDSPCFTMDTELCNGLINRRLNMPESELSLHEDDSFTNKQLRTSHTLQNGGEALALISHLNDSQADTPRTHLIKARRKSGSSDFNSSLSWNLSDGVLFPVFIEDEGSQPTKVDLDVFRAIEDVHIDTERYPLIDRWKRHIQSYSLDSRERWPSPSSPRYRSRANKRIALWSC